MWTLLAFLASEIDFRKHKPQKSILLWKQHVENLKQVLTKQSVSEKSQFQKGHKVKLDGTFHFRVFRSPTQGAKLKVQCLIPFDRLKAVD